MFLDHTRCRNSVRVLVGVDLHGREVPFIRSVIWLGRNLGNEELLVIQAYPSNALRVLSRTVVGNPVHRRMIAEWTRAELSRLSDEYVEVLREHS